MRLNEAYAKDLLARRGIKVPRGIIAATPEAARAAYKGMGVHGCVVKAHVQQGGRGKAGFVRAATDADAVEGAARALLGNTLRGERVREVLVEERKDAAAEIYVAVVVDPSEGRPMLLLSQQGGVDIEDAAEVGNGVTAARFRPGTAVRLHQVRALAADAGFTGSLAAKVSLVAWELVRLFTELEATIVEINPLVVTTEGELWAVDAKVELDEDAGFRRLLPIPSTSADEWERRALELGLTFVPLGGDVALFGMGAGLTLTTLDRLADGGVRAANFLELRGGTKSAHVRRSLDFLLDWSEEHGVDHVLLVASLTGTPLLAFVTGLKESIAGRATPPAAIAAIHATGAALYSMSLDHARAELESVGVTWIDSIEDAVVEACVRAGVLEGAA